MGKRFKDECAAVCMKEGAKYFTFNSNGAYCEPDKGCLCWCHIMKGETCNKVYWSNDDLYKIGK